MSPDDAQRLRASLDARIINQSDGADTYPLRRRLAYQRVLRRLGAHSAGTWVLKGGYLLEARLDTRARATKDLDLAMREAGSGADVAALLREALSVDIDGDHFTFTVSTPVALATDSQGKGAWRVTVDAALDARSFAKLRIDLVERLGEIDDALEVVVIPSPIRGVTLPDAVVTAVNIPQHAAEKFHALCLVFSDGRQNTRVKDLLDIILMAESGLLPHPELPVRVRAVFMARNKSAPPSTLPVPPASWRRDFETLAASTGSNITDLDVAFAVAVSLFTANRLPS